MIKRAGDIRPGDKVIGHDDDAERRVTCVSRGFWRGSVIIEWNGGWCCIDSTAQVLVA